MDKTKIIGRIKECERLDECMSADRAQLVIVYGRRRVGKTYLINEYFENSFAFKLTGTYGKDKSVQLHNFISTLNRKMCEKHDDPENWFDAFGLLRDYIETLPKDTKQVVFFDEVPWLDNQKSDFLHAFEWFWNDWASTMDNLVFIVCGSATSWMDDKIANNKGGLFGRQTCKLFLLPFKLCEVEEYLKKKNINWSRYDIIQCYMIMGGIPYYLSLLKRKMSLAQNIDELFFSKDAELWDECDHLYKTLFSNSESYVKVVEALSHKKGGMTRKEIISKIKTPSGGDLTKILKNLELSGFIRMSGFYNKKKKDTLYQLCDYYTSFYFKFIKDNHGRDEHYWSNAIDNPSRRAWEGLVFEQICKDHIFAIKRKLGINGVLSEEYSWFVRGDIKTGIDGAQIDLLIDRRDRVISLCEIKFANGEYVITKGYDLALRNKVEAFKLATNTKASIQLVMITTYGIKNNQYASVVHNQVIMDDLFISMYK